jgi:hypothetical protein
MARSQNYGRGAGTASIKPWKLEGTRRMRTTFQPADANRAVNWPNVRSMPLSAVIICPQNAKRPPSFSLPPVRQRRGNRLYRFT